MSLEIHNHRSLARARNPLIKDFWRNRIRFNGEQGIELKDLGLSERMYILRYLRNLSTPLTRKTKLIKSNERKTEKISEEKKRTLKEKVLSLKIDQIIEEKFSSELSSRWESIRQTRMLGGHDFTVTKHILEGLKYFLELASKSNISEENIFIGAITMLLHDIGKLGGKADYFHPLRSAAIGKRILDELKCFNKIEKQRIIALVQNHSLIGNLTIHGENSQYPKNKDTAILIGGRTYSKGRLYAIGPISDSQYIVNSLKSFKNNPDDLKILLLIQLADTYAVKKDGVFLTSIVADNFNKTYQRLILRMEKMKLPKE